MQHSELGKSSEAVRYVYQLLEVGAYHAFGNIIDSSTPLYANAVRSCSGNLKRRHQASRQRT